MANISMDLSVYMIAAAHRESFRVDKKKKQKKLVTNAFQCVCLCVCFLNGIAIFLQKFTRPPPKHSRV